MKIFKSVVNDKELMIRPSGKPDYMVLGIRDSHLHGRVEMIGISREDIPSVMVAMAESVGWPEEDEYSVTHTILHDLGQVIKAQDRTTAEDKELEAENTGTSPRAYNWLLDRAEQVSGGGES